MAAIKVEPEDGLEAYPTSSIGVYELVSIKTDEPEIVTVKEETIDEDSQIKVEAKDEEEAAQAAEEHEVYPDNVDLTDETLGTHSVFTPELVVCSKTEENDSDTEMTENRNDYIIPLKSRKKRRKSSGIFVSAKSRKCEVCGKICSSSSFSRHVLTHTGEKRYSCAVCQKKFSCLNNLKTHIRIHTGEKPYKCDLCEKEFIQLGHLTDHKRLHSGEKPYECALCGKKYSSRSSFKKHCISHSETKRSRPSVAYNCSLCEMTFSSRNAFKRHCVNHSLVNNSKCEICNKVLAGNRSLQAHLLTHSGYKTMYNCEICNKSFSFIHNLKRHYVVHTKEKPFKCDVCSVTFSVKDNLKRHYRVHTGEKPYECDVCMMKFAHNDSLKGHYLKHTGEWPHICPVCKKGFPRLRALVLHQRTHRTLIENCHV